MTKNGKVTKTAIHGFLPILAKKFPKGIHIYPSPSPGEDKK